MYSLVLFLPLPPGQLLLLLSFQQVFFPSRHLWTSLFLSRMHRHYLFQGKGKQSKWVVIPTPQTQSTISKISSDWFRFLTIDSDYWRSIPITGDRFRLLTIDFICDAGYTYRSYCPKIIWTELIETKYVLTNFKLYFIIQTCGYLSYSFLFWILD